jgi:4-amino-4-deoxy-L-arabinose transferase-like glycosyltransferase
MKEIRWHQALLLVVGVGLMLLGQFWLVYRRESWRTGIAFWIAAALSLGLLWFEVQPRQRRMALGLSRGLGWQKWAWLRLLSAVGGTCLAVWAGLAARRLPNTADFSGVLWFWLFGVYWFLVAFVPAVKVQEIWPRLTRWLRDDRVELACLAALLLAALAVRVVDLEHIPPTLGGDEGTQGIEALSIFGPPLTNPFSTGWYDVPTMSFVWYGLGMRIFGATVAGLRTLPALVGAITVLTTFLLARELWGRRVAWFSALAIAFGHFHLHYSRLGSNQIGDGLFVTLTLWLLALGLRSRRAIHFALAGAVLGLGWYGYYGARLIGIVVAFYLTGLAVVESHFLSRYGRFFLVLLIAALVVMAPLLFHFAAHPDVLVSRTREVNVLASGWLAERRAATGHSTARVLLEQFWKSVTAFNYTLDPRYWYRATIPLLDFVSGGLLIVGMACVIGRRCWRSDGLLLIWFWAAVILGWTLTENPPSSMRLVIVAPALALLVGIGLDGLLTLSQRVLGGKPRNWDRVAAFLLGTVAVLNVHYYFVVYTPKRIYGDPTGEIATVLSRYLAERNDGYTVYFYGAPVMYWGHGPVTWGGREVFIYGHGTIRFMARDVRGMDILPPDEGEPPPPDLTHGARFVFLPHRFDELEAIRTQYPGGEESSVYSDVDGRLLYTLYEVPPPH